jgi:GTPase SAR1 family protein
MSSKSVRESVFEVCRTKTFRSPGVRLKDLTERVLRDLTPPLDSEMFPKDRIDLITVAAFGQPGSGKTTLIEHLASHFVQVYDDQANIVGIRGSRFSDLAAKMDDRPVQFLVVDDAKAMSRAGMKNLDDMNELDDIRHRYKEIRLKTGNSASGYIVAIHVKQRYKDLDIKFRQAHYRFWKTTAGPDDKWDMISQIGPEAYGFLERIMRRINELRDQTAKGECIVTVDWIRGSGRFYSSLPEQSNVNWLRVEDSGELHRTTEIDPSAIAEEGGAFVIDTAPIIALIIKEGGDWRLKVDVFNAYQGAASQSQVAEQFKISQGSVSNYAKEVRGMISKIVGEAYEKWAAKQWEKEPGVVKVERFGGKGEPDILVHHASGKFTVVSCKCYYDNKTTSIPIKAIEPELLKAKELQAAGLLERLVVDFNNIAKKSRQLRGIDPEHHDSVITFR